MIYKNDFDNTGCFCDSSDLHDPSLKVANPLSPQCVCRLSVSRTILSTVVFPF